MGARTVKYIWRSLKNKLPELSDEELGQVSGGTGGIVPYLINEFDIENFTIDRLRDLLKLFS